MTAPKRGPKPKKPAAVKSALPAGWAPPPHLSEAAAEAWSQLAARLDAAGKLAATDPTLVEAYAVNVAILREAQKSLALDGVLLLNGAGVPVANPACALVNSATMRIKSVLDGLGSVQTASNEPKQSKWGGIFGSAG